MSFNKFLKILLLSGGLTSLATATNFSDEYQDSQKSSLSSLPTSQQIVPHEIENAATEQKLTEWLTKELTESGEISDKLADKIMEHVNTHYPN